MEDEERLEKHKSCRFFVKLIQAPHSVKILGLKEKELGQITRLGLKYKVFGAKGQTSFKKIFDFGNHIP